MICAGICTLPYRCGVRSLLVAASLLCTSALGAQTRQATLVVALMRDTIASSGASTARGLTFGIEEAVRTARLFDTRLRVVRSDSAAVVAPTDAVSATAWVIAGDAEPCAALRRTLDAAGVLIVDAGCQSRGAPLAREVRIRPDPGDPSRNLATHDTASRMVLWHESLERFGAGQLNDRFRRRFGVGMDSDAWSAWLATKIATEALLLSRARKLPPAGVLLDPRSAFDGHKGAPLRFDPETHRLVQPLYRLEWAADAQRVIELPAPVAATREP